MHFKILRTIQNRQRIYLSSFIISMAGLLFMGCSERQPDNPFDPGGTNKSPLVLTVASEDNNNTRLKWRWRGDPITDYAGFRIYRSVGDDQSYVLYRELPRNQFSFTDSLAQKYDWHFYRVSVYSALAESLPSPQQKIYLGQGEYWVLSSYGFWIRKVSYDLLRTINHFEIFYPPEEWAISLSDSVIWLGFFRYSRGVSQFNLPKATEDFFYFEDLNSPIDVEYDEQQQKVYILDVNGGGQNDRIHILRNKTVQNKILLPQGNYLKLFLSESDQSLLILGESKIFRLSLGSMTLTDSLLFSQGFIAQDMDASSDSVFVLTLSRQDTLSKIYKTSTGLGSVDSLIISGGFYRITYDGNSDCFYLAENMPAATDEVAKLSRQGIRLLRLTGFNLVEQIGLNPHDQSIVVVDRFGDRLILFDKNGNEVSRSRQEAFYDPIRIFIQ